MLARTDYVVAMLLWDAPEEQSPAIVVFDERSPFVKRMKERLAVFVSAHHAADWKYVEESEHKLRLERADKKRTIEVFNSLKPHHCTGCQYNYLVTRNHLTAAARDAILSVTVETSDARVVNTDDCDLEKLSAFKKMELQHLTTRQ